MAQVELNRLVRALGEVCKDLMVEGVRLLRRLKKNRPAIEVITLSVPSGFRLSLESMKLEAFADLLMPFDLEDLAGKILEAWERKKAKKSGPLIRGDLKISRYLLYLQKPETSIPRAG